MRLARLTVTLAGALALLQQSSAHAAEPEALTQSEAAVVAASYDAAAQDEPGYAGVRVTPAGRIDVYATGDTAALRGRATATGHGVSFAFQRAGHSLRDLLDVRDRVRAQASGIAASGIDIGTWGPDIPNNTLRIGVANLLPEHTAALRATFGPAVSVERSRRPTKTSSRLYDVAPWNGGDFIAMDNGSDCTTGPPVYKPSTGQKFLLTAGHCFLGSTATTGLTGFSFRTFQGSHLMGTGASPFMGYAAAEQVRNGYDAALIATNPSRLAWRTQRATDTVGSAPQYAAQGSVVGAPVCASGAFSGERCGATVRYVNQDTRSFDGFVQVNMVAAENPNVAIVGPGDSGGPVYQVHSGQLLMTGMIVAAGDESRNPYPNPLRCPQNDQAGRGTACTDVVWYHDLPSLMNHLGVALKTF